MYILLVDDEEKSRGVLAKLLRTLGHQVTECSGGHEAIETFSTREFHLVITDIRMPRMSGMELLQRTRALPHNQEAEVILFTGYGDMQSAIEALRSGAYDYLVKPINFKELCSRHRARGGAPGSEKREQGVDQQIRCCGQGGYGGDFQGTLAPQGGLRQEHGPRRRIFLFCRYVASH